MKRVNKKYFSVMKKSIKVYEKGYLLDNINIPNFKDKKLFNNFCSFLKKYIDGSIPTVDKLKASGSIRRFKDFSSFFRKEVIFDVKNFEAYLSFLDKIRTKFSFNRNNIVSFLFNIGINLVFIPFDDHCKNPSFKYIESVSTYIKDVPTIIIFLNSNYSLNKRIFNNIFYSIYYLIFPNSSYMKANKFSYTMILSNDIILGELNNDIKGEFLSSLKNDKEFAKGVFSRIYIKTGLPIINIIKTLLSIDYLDRYKNEGFFKDVIDEIERDIMVGSLKPEPIMLGNMADYLTKNKHLLYKKD